MAEVQKPLEVSETTPVVAALEPVVPETTPAVEPTAAAETSAVAGTEAEETSAAATTEAAAPVEEVKKEVKPIEKGRLEHKASPASFPK